MMTKKNGDTNFWLLAALILFCTNHNGFGWVALVMAFLVAVS